LEAKAVSTDTFPQVDENYLVATLSKLAKVSTVVPMGWDTFMEPDDPKLVHYVQQVIRPELDQLDIRNLLDVPRNNLVVELGTGEIEDALLIQNYTVVQHHNLMQDPHSGKIGIARAHGDDRPAVFGQGVSQSKAHQAVMLAVLKSLKESGVEIRGKLYWAVNNEGLSSHHCSDAILDQLDQKPSFGVIQLGTGLRLSLGNRGRVDVNVHVQGKVAHSSTPQEGLSAIDGASEAMDRLRAMTWDDTHPQLGGRQALPYKVRYEPLAPHTLPSDAYIAVDRRLLPGDDPDAATDEVRAQLGDLAPFRSEVSRGYFMLPSMVDADNAWVQDLQSSIVEVRGKPADTVYGQGAFDAGGPTARGVPTIMYGASGGEWPTGVDFVAIADAMDEAGVLARLISRRLL
jgi:acetylornithine deacetylase/succinyl-diaminopimelate desuccinylase-like protein